MNLKSDIELHSQEAGQSDPAGTLANSLGDSDKRGRLAGKVAVVTGGTSGIGDAVVRRFVQEGARVCVVSLPAESDAGEQLIASLGSDRVLYVPADVRSSHDVDKAIEAAVDRFGCLDILINNAAIDYPGSSPLVIDSDLESTRRVFDVNVFGALLVLQSAARAMRGKGGSIVNVASRAALVGIETMGVYGASKAALLAITRVAAAELAPEIRVNAVAPGATETTMMRMWFDYQPDPAASEKAMVAGIPQGRLAQPTEIAEAMLFLASDESSAMTGACVSVDGGYTAV